MEYNHEQAGADKVNVDFDVYRIRTPISEHGSTVNAGFEVDKRDRLTRKMRRETLDDNLTYGAIQLDRDVVAKDQLRTVIRTFKDRLFAEIFSGRTEVPKTLIFAKDDSHADDIVQMVREEFGNPRGQITVRNTGLPGTDHNQVVYQLACSKCGHNYGANGSDIHERRCPKCYGGLPGLPFDGGRG